MENYLRPKTTWVHDKQFGNNKINRALNEMFSEAQDLSNYDDERQLPQISETRIGSNSRKLPPLTFMR